MTDPMRCQDFLEHYSAYRDGTDPDLVAAMTDHMASCSICRAHDRAVREGVETLRGELLAPSPDFEARLRARLERSEAPEEIAPRVPSFALTAIALLVVTLTLVAVRRPPTVATAAAEEPPVLLAKPRAQAGIPFVAFEPNR